MTDIEMLRNIIDNSENIVFFGGAGVSTESGIPDFRGNGGLYTKESDDVSPEEKLHISYLKANPSGFYEYYKNNMICTWAKPNDAHYMLANLEKEGKLKAVITQNIDGLHQMAGSQRVIELHGTVHKNYCMDCGTNYPLDYVLESDGVPYCEKCGGVVRPDVVMYGEGLDAKAWYEAEEAIYNCDTLIVGGTSLTVYPACTLVDNYEGEHLIIINKTPTPKDSDAELVINEPIGKTLKEALQE